MDKKKENQVNKLREKAKRAQPQASAVVDHIRKHAKAVGLRVSTSDIIAAREADRR